MCLIGIDQAKICGEYVLYYIAEHSIIYYALGCICTCGYGHEPAYTGKDTTGMVICRNCHTSWPDDCKFCGMCGYQTSKLADKETLQLTDHAKHLKKARTGSRQSNLTATVLSLVVIFIATIVLCFAYLDHKNFTDTLPASTLTAYGKAIAGQTLQVIGQHFTPGHTVFVSVDDQPLVKNGSIVEDWVLTQGRRWEQACGRAQAPLIRGYGICAYHGISYVGNIDASGTPVAVQADGTFTVKI